MHAKLLLSALSLLLAGSFLHAGEPQATFALVKGDLEIRVEQDGKPSRT